MRDKNFFHFMPLPMTYEEGFSLDNLLGVLIWLLPFLAIYLWHLWHDHRHNDKLIKKLDAVIDLLKKIKDRK